MNNSVKLFLLYSVLVALLIYAITQDLNSNTIMKQPLPSDTTYTKTQIYDSLFWVVGNWEDHILNKDDSQIEEYTEAFYKAQNEFKIPAFLLVGMGYRESRYRTNTKGARDELGILQVCPMGQRHCKEYCKDLETIEDQIMCGGCWFAAGNKQCKSLEGGLTAYLSGKCKTDNVRTIRVRNIRYNLWEALHNAIVK